MCWQLFPSCVYKTKRTRRNKNNSPALGTRILFLTAKFSSLAITQYLLDAAQTISTAAQLLIFHLDVCVFHQPGFAVSEAIFLPEKFKHSFKTNLFENRKILSHFSEVFKFHHYCVQVASS